MGAHAPRHAGQRGRHRRRTSEKRRSSALRREGDRGRTPGKRHLAAGVALVSASVITGAAIAPPAPPPPPPKPIANSDVGLTAAASLLNVPLNLLIDLINIPHNEIRAIDYTAKAFMFSGPWFVVGPTNVWGVDPGDPPKFMSLINVLTPFPALSGIDLDEFDQNGLGQQVWYYVATQLPTSVHCDDEGCTPTVPTAPITGIAMIDSTLWSLAILTGQVRFPLFDNWFKVPISDLMTGYHFGPDYPGRVSPAGEIFPMFGFAGTVYDEQTGQYVVPWDDDTFTLDLSKPFQNYWNHLMADPATNPIKLPDLEQLARGVQSLAAAMAVAFWPLTAGSFFCPGDCGFLPPAFDYPGVVKFIGDLWPGNEVIDTWLQAFENGTANVPTDEQIELAIKLKEGHFWSFGHPSPPADFIKGFNFSSLAPAFHAFWTALGFNPPPLEEEPFQDPDVLDAPDTPDVPAADPDTEVLAMRAEQDEAAGPVPEVVATPSEDNGTTHMVSGVVPDDPTVESESPVESDAATTLPDPPATAPDDDAETAGSGRDLGSVVRDGLERITKFPKGTGTKSSSNNHVVLSGGGNGGTTSPGRAGADTGTSTTGGTTTGNGGAGSTASGATSGATSGGSSTGGANGSGGNGGDSSGGGGGHEAA